MVNERTNILNRKERNERKVVCRWASSERKIPTNEENCQADPFERRKKQQPGNQQTKKNNSYWVNAVRVLLVADDMSADDELLGVD